MTTKRLNEILELLLKGDLSPLYDARNISDISSEAVRLINSKNNLNADDVSRMNLIISISQLVYNNTDRTMLFLDDGVYDLLLEVDKEYNPSVQVGAPDVSFNDNKSTLMGRKQIAGEITPIIYLDNVDDYNQKQLFKDNLNYTPDLDLGMYRSRREAMGNRDSDVVLSRKKTEVSHKYPKLVGTLDKCKFVLNEEATCRGVYNDPAVKIFERDFLGKHLQMGLIDRHTPFEMVLELKYDGVSVEAEVTDHIISALSRGDTSMDKAADLTPVLGGYKFYYCPEFKPGEKPIGMKFEAMMMRRDLDRYSQFRKYPYANSRNGITGLLSSSDAYNYRDLITLIPLATSIEGISRKEEIDLLNKYYSSGEYLRHAVIHGTYDEILYQVYKFEKEAEYLRPIMPMDYDGIVVSYTDPRIINALGRKNSTNKYSIAIKFNPAVKNAIFTGYSYTVGQNGVITPMIHYTPVEFFGTIHDKSSGHSYAKFMELNLRIGDILDVEYRNDVMPYVSKSNASQNDNNPNPVIEFPTVCPSCGYPIEILTSRKRAVCNNPMCPERIVARAANMMDKLGLKDFGEARIAQLGITRFYDLINYDYNKAKQILGDAIGDKLIQSIEYIKNTPIPDYILMGAIGFSNISTETWRKILSNIFLHYFRYTTNKNDLASHLAAISGVGQATVNTILRELPYFMKDIECIIDQCKPVYSSNQDNQKPSRGKIRITGFRNPKLIEVLREEGFDASDSGVTKDTNVLIVPYDGFTSSKVAKAIDYNSKGCNIYIVSYEEYVTKMNLQNRL